MMVIYCECQSVLKCGGQFSTANYATQDNYIGGLPAVHAGAK